MKTNHALRVAGLDDMMSKEVLVAHRAMGPERKNGGGLKQ